MNIEIWSDVMCPFCYIGKRRLEQTLQEFEHSDDIHIEWKSFQLNPELETDPDKNVTEYLAEVKGWSIEQADQINHRVTDMAREVGLKFNFDKAVVANSFDAHRFAHFAKERDKGHDAEEALFKAYFTDGKNTADHQNLAELGKQIGLDKKEVLEILKSDRYANAVREDIREARDLQIQGVPFFLFNRKYAVSGAQAIDVFANALTKSWQDWKQEATV